MVGVISTAEARAGAIVLAATLARLCASGNTAESGLLADSKVLDSSLAKSFDN